MGGVHHGHSAAEGRGSSLTYNSWASMIQRCSNPRHPKYRMYGARGIVACSRWKDFKEFLSDMGERPIGTTLGRIDSKGNYEPGNCRWETPSQQQRNIKHNHWIEHQGIRLCITDWAARLGIHQTTISHRISSGWEIDKVLSPPERLTPEQRRAKGRLAAAARWGRSI